VERYVEEESVAVQAVKLLLSVVWEERDSVEEQRVELLTPTEMLVVVDSRLDDVLHYSCCCEE